MYQVKISYIILRKREMTRKTMSKLRRVLFTCRFIIPFLLVSLILTSLLCHSFVFAKSAKTDQFLLSDNATSTYPMSSVLKRLPIDLNLNSSSQYSSSSPESIANSMRNTNETTPIAGQHPYIAANRNFVFSQNKSELSSPTNNSHTGEFGEAVKIAAVMPTFTAAAYNNAFYVFYNKYDNFSRGVNITTDLNLLSSKVTNTPSSSASGFAMIYLLGNLKWISPDSKISFLTDQDVDGGSIFQGDGSNAFDVVILGHQEYVTQKEYDNLKQFVAEGGTMMVLDGNVFYAQVKYDRTTGNVTLVKGHSWAFNGKSAWRSVGERWKNETMEWVGSNYISNIAKFGNNPFEYSPHEEQFITNPKDVILLDYNATVPSVNSDKSGGVVVATYELNYLKGRVIAIGLYSDDIITNGSFDRYFDNLIHQYAVRSED